ncbi:MAG: bifunctional shikimate kinase/3-dehydroquinate synthase [Acidimicrobiales bacterium]|jgi:5-deoxy-5-amino-3-dehydroquinate synthase
MATVPRDRRHIVLVGMMGSGKSSVGRQLAALLDRRFVDTDEQIAAVGGGTVAELWSTGGESRVRELESAVLAEAIAAPGASVIAVGGGAVLDPANRAAIAKAGDAVWLRASVDTLVERLGDGAGRPLLEPDPAAALRRLESERRPLYAEVAGVIVDVDGFGPAAAVDAVLGTLQRRVEVALLGHPYEVVIGPGARHLLASVLPPAAKRAAIVTQAGVNVAVSTGVAEVEFAIGPGEQAKSLRTIETLCRGFAAAGLTRADVVVAVGGGVVTDVAGFAAASYCRGIAVIHVATTLLAQVDAAIGGKTGVNLPEGKNLVGAFWQPTAVLCDTDALWTLPERDWRSGLGEMAKYECLGLADLDELPLVDQIASCAAAKAAIVAADERDADRRMTLNYGHTLAHALEAAGFAESDGASSIRHGEAVAIGLVFAARLAAALGRIDDGDVRRHVGVVERYGLASAIPASADLDELLVFMARDKKTRTGLSFVLDGPRGVEFVDDVDPAAVRAALRATQAATPAGGTLSDLRARSA